MSRQSRNRRRVGVTVELTDRDRALLQAVDMFRIARTSDLVAYAFRGVRRDTAAVRLRRLYDARLLAVLPPRLGAENVYRLGPAARAGILLDGGQPGRVPRGGHQHHLATVSAWVALAGVDGFQLELTRPDWELRESFDCFDLTVIPDLFTVVRTGDATVPLAVEVDCGTESTAVLTRKLDAYRSLWGQPPGLFGYERFGVAVVCAAKSRGSQLAALLKKAWVVPHVLWTVPEDPSTALRKLFDDCQHPLETSPYGKGC